MFKHKILLLALLAAASALPLSQACLAQIPTPTAAEKLRRLLPLPEETLRQPMDLSIGLKSAPHHGTVFFRYGYADDITQLIALRRTLTGGTADAPRYSSLGWLYRQAGLLKQSQAAFHRSQALYDAALQKHPRDGRALAGHGGTLQALGQAAAAEAYLRKATQIAPESADVWMAFGSALAAQASPRTEAANHSSMRQAAAAFSRAVLLAPQNPAVWAARGNFQTFTLPGLLGKPPSAAGLRDYEKAAALSPDDPTAQIQVPDMELFVVETAHHLYTSPETAKAASRSFNLRVEASLRRLTKIARAHHGRRSASAYKARAWVQFEYFYDFQGAQKSLALALQQDPRRRDAADYQIHVAAVTGSYAQMAFLCRREMALHPEARLRVMLAYADYSLAQQKPKYWQEGLRQMEIVHAAAPRDDAASLGLTTFLLATGQTARANLLLTQLAAKAAARPNAQQVEYDVTRGIGAALAGRTEEAQGFLGLARKAAPKNGAAKAALALLPPVPPAVDAEMRRLLPFPDHTLDSKIELTMGLSYSQDRRFHISRESTDYAVQETELRRRLTGGAADAPLYRILGNVYRRAGRTRSANAAFLRSETLYSRRLRRHPANGPALAGFGRTLDAAGQDSKAELYLQKAVQVAPRSADVWLALGFVLENQSDPKTESAKHYARRAAAAYNRAILLAPENPAAWAARGNFRTWSVPQMQGKSSSRGGLSDYAHAAALSPDDPYAQALVAWTDCLTFELAHHVFTSLKAAKMEPPLSDHRTEAILRHLTALASAGSRRQSAAAYTARAWVQYEFFCDSEGAQKSLRLALRQNPSEQDAIDYQLHVLSFAQNNARVAAACRQELRRRPELWLRVLLAYADYHLALQKPAYRQEGLMQMELAHAAAPRDYAVSLGLATFLLAWGQTAQANSLLNKLAPEALKQPKEQRVEYDLTRGIGAALAGNGEGAKSFLGLARKDDPKNAAAKAVLALLPG